MSEVSILSRRVMNMVSRGIISKTDDEPGMQNVQVSLLYQEGKARSSGCRTTASRATRQESRK